MEFPYFKRITKGLEERLINNYPDYYKEIFKYVEEDNITISERIWLFQHNLKETPKCQNCDKKVKFIKFYKGYRKYCSRKCAAEHTNKDEIIKNKRIKNMILCNYDDNKRKSMTLLANKTKSQFSKEKNNEINEKRYITNIEKYGVKNISQNEVIKEKISKKLKDILPIIKLEKSKKIIEDVGFKIVSIDDNEFTLICPHCNKEFNIHRTLFNSRKRFGITICLNCNPNNKNSDFENQVYQYIESIYNKNIIRQYKKLKKYEIDIYLEDIKIGFECNGLWWHSEHYKEKNYHKNKTSYFNELGIKIIHIWEDDWRLKSNIIKSRVKNILNITENTIYARNCKIVKINTNDSKEFLNKNHLQGYCIAKINIGLLYNNKIVSLMSFGSYRKSLGRKSIENEYELLRFCSEINTNVTGGFSKLLNNFITEYNVNKIITYANKDWSSGDLYEKNGFSYINESEPNYYYFNKDCGIRLNRFSFRKDKLVKDGHPKEKTEHEIMNGLGYYRIYNSGNLLYEKVIKLNINI